MNGKVLSAVVAFFVALLVLLSCLFTVKQGQMSVKLHFGKLVKDDSGKVIQYQPGLHVMIPIVNTIKTNHFIIIANTVIIKIKI